MVGGAARPAAAAAAERRVRARECGPVRHLWGPGCLAGKAVYRYSPSPVEARMKHELLMKAYDPPPGPGRSHSVRTTTYSPADNAAAPRRRAVSKSPKRR